MKKTILTLSVLAALVLLLATSNYAFAQATRTWVSGVGDDANPCSRTAPCKTFAGAISKTAAGGEINVLDPGGFGAVTITKSITIDGSGGSIAGVLVSGTNGIVISASASDVVTLRNLDIDGLNTGLSGIKFIAGGALNVENVEVYEFTGPGIDFEPNQAGNSQLSVSDVIAHNDGGGGILVKPAGGGTANASVLRFQSYQNLFGVRGEDRSNTTVFNTVVASSTANGYVAFSAGTATNLFLESSVASNNATNGINSTGAAATIRLSNMTITGNNVGLTNVSGGAIISFGNNKNAGNGTNGAPTSTIGLQ